jgi:hypothetical protein
MTFRLVTWVLPTCIAVGLCGCASDPTRITDTQVRSGDRPECQSSAARGNVPLASGTETASDPCGNSGTVPILTGDDLRGHPGQR